MRAKVAARPRGSALPRLGAYLALGRVSNLPTVWTNTLAGIALAGGTFDAHIVFRLATATSLFYVGGMFLNDAFDREVDRRERPGRPIPSGRVTAGEVFTVGFGLIALGLASLAEGPATSLASGLALGGLVVLYDVWHKQNPWSPVVMGLCRAAVYVTAGLGAGGVPGRSLLEGALALGAYVVGLTFVARQENRKSYRAGGTLALLAAPIPVALAGPTMGAVACGALVVLVSWVVLTVRPLFANGPVNVPRSVVRLIAGISLVDALLVSSYGAATLVPLCLAGFGLTLSLQRWVSGT